MIISMRKVVRARRVRRCSNCNALLDVGAPYVSYYGAAERGDVPYTLPFCESCSVSVEARRERSLRAGGR
jgi:hypothetical protein